MTVYFYSIEPAPSFDGVGGRFLQGSFPRDEVFSTIRSLDPAAEEYRIRDGLFAGETFCVLHEEGPEPIMGAYYRDNLSKPYTEYKGEVSELFLRDGEALVDASYAAFFPGDVVGLVRTSSKAPGFAKIGNWLSVLGGYPCGLFALRDSNVLSQIEEHPTLFRRVLLRIRRERIDAVASSSPGLAETLRSAANLNSFSTEVGVELRTSANGDAEQWSRQTLREVEDLIGILPDFEEAKVKLAGQRKPVNLLRANIQHQMQVPIVGSKRVGPGEAADALFKAYELERHAINKVLSEGRRGEHGPPHS